MTLEATHKIDPKACNWTGLRKASRRISLMYDRYLAPSGLTSGQFAILAEIVSWPADQGPSLSQLAQALVMDRTALTHTLKPMIRDGLISFAAAKNDRRTRLVQITRSGKRRLEEGQKRWSAAQAHFLQCFGEDQAAALRALLRLVNEVDFNSVE